MEDFKKQGLQQTQYSFICSQKNIVMGGIPKKFIVSSKLQLDHLLCPLCKNIIWKPVACGQNTCFSSFCQYCIYHSDINEQQNIIIEQGEQPVKKCPKCTKTFKKTTIPLLNTLLSSLVIKCIHNNCRQEINYEGFLKHVLNCEFKKIKCDGCKQFFIQKNIEKHKQVCNYIVLKCEKCQLSLPQIQFHKNHNSIKCLQTQLEKKNNIISVLQGKVNDMKSRLNNYQNIMDKIIKGQNLQLAIQFYSSFPINFQFINNQVKLIKSSWNTNKQKFDFLHFYITYPIKTESFVGAQWKLHVKTLQGNLLIGVCSSLCTNSVDFVINKFGEIKKKQSNQNKYKLVRKSCLTFSESDVLIFKYQALRRYLKIQNQTKNVECKLDAKQIGEIGQNLYTFYSLDTLNDTVKFI